MLGFKGMHHVPPLPIEIVEQAVDYLRYDPPNLLSCALVCRAWASRSCYFLRREETLTIRSAAEMYLYGSLLASKRSRGLYAKVRVLRMIDNPTRPFVHILPLCFPGQYLPEAATVVLENINWSITHPHPLFFSCLSRFASVSGICLHECTLRPAHAQRIARSLPKLETVVENSVDPVSLPKATMLFQSILIGTERELNLHQRMHPDAQHQDLSQGALSHHFEAFVAFMHIAKVCALVSAGLSLHTGPAFQHTAPLDACKQHADAPTAREQSIRRSTGQSYCRSGAQHSGKQGLRVSWRTSSRWEFSVPLRVGVLIMSVP